MLHKKTDEELMVAYAQGDETAFRQLYDLYSPKIFGYLKHKLKSEPDARDVFQSTFMKLHRSIQLYKSTLPFAPWLFTICRNEMIDFLRKKNALNEVLAEDASDHPAQDKIDLQSDQNPFYKNDPFNTIILPPSPFKSSETMSQTQGPTSTDINLSALNRDQQIAIIMRYSEDSTFEDIARRLNTTPINARQIVSRSIQLLKGLYANKK